MELTSLIFLQVEHDMFFVFLDRRCCDSLSGLGLSLRFFPFKLLHTFALGKRLLLRWDCHHQVVIAACAAVLQLTLVGGVLLLDFEHGLALASVSVNEFLLWLAVFLLLIFLFLLNRWFFSFNLSYKHIVRLFNSSLLAAFRCTLCLVLDLCFELVVQFLRELGACLALLFLRLFGLAQFDPPSHAFRDELARPIHKHPLRESELWFALRFKLKCIVVQCVQLFTIVF